MAKDVIINIKANSRDAEAVLKNLEKSMGNFGKGTSVVSSKANSNFQKVGVGAVALGNLVAVGVARAIDGLQASLGDAVSRLDTLNAYPAIMSNLGVATDKSTASISRLSEGLQGLPTTLNDAALSVQRLTSVNSNIDASTDMFLALNNAILAGNAPMQMQSSALEQLSQAYSKGKFDLMEWRTLSMAMPGQLKQLAVSMGYVGQSDLYEALSNGSVSMNDFMRQIVQLNNQGAPGFESFAEQARNSTSGVATSIMIARTAITRGLADIMNAIGQANISSFFIGVANAINATIPYIVAFIRIMATAVSFVGGVFSKVFGGGGASKTAKATKEIASNASSASTAVGGIGAGAGQAAGGLGKAAKEAKKLNKQLAGFDEMNVLTDNSASDAGAGGGGGGAGGGGMPDMTIPEWDVPEDAGNKVLDKAGEIIEKLKGLFGDIDFGPLKKSFEGLVASIKPLVDLGMGGLKWLWDNILKPLAGWAIEKAIPAVFDALAGAFKIMEPFLEGVGRGLQFIYDYFFVPMAAVVGGAIVGIFEGLASAFEWISQNEFAVQLLKDFGTAIGIIAGVMLAFNIVWGIAGVLTAIFAGAMAVLTSPIFLVVAAIAAVIAIIALLIIAWDKIKEVAGKVWDKIKEVWAKVAKWFDDNVIKPTVAFFKGLWEDIKGVFNVVVNWFKDIFVKAWNGVKSAWSSVSSFFSGIWSGVKNVFSTVGSWFGNIFTGAWNAVKNAFSSVKSFFSGIWDSIKSIFGTIGNKIGDTVGGAFKGTVNGVIGFVQGFVNKPINAINGLLDVINKVPGVNIGRLPSVSLPRMAKGGIVDRATMAIIGEDGREAVMPLERNTGWIDDLAGKLSDRGGAGGGFGTIIVKVGEDTLVTKVIDGINDRTDMSGQNTIRV